MVLPGGDTTFSVILANTFPGMLFTWLRKGGRLSEGTKFKDVNTNALTVTSAAKEDEGSYRLFIVRTDTLCVAISDTATLTVCE